MQLWPSGNFVTPALPLSHWNPDAAALITLARKAPKPLLPPLSPSLQMRRSLSPPAGQHEELFLRQALECHSHRTIEHAHSGQKFHLVHVIRKGKTPVIDFSRQSLSL